MSSMNSLRRKFPRFKINASARLVAQGAEQAVLRLVDVSIQGMRGITSQHLNVNGEVEIILDNPAVKRPVLKKARVVWTRPTEDDQCEAGFSVQHLELDNFRDETLRQHRETFPRFSVYGAPAQEELEVVGSADADKPWDLRDSLIVLLCFLLVVGAFLKMPVSEPVKNVGTSAASVVSRVLSNFGRDRFNLEGVVHEPDGLKYITVNGQIVGEGEEIQNVFVKKISSDSIEIERNGNNEIVSVP